MILKDLDYLAEYSEASTPKGGLNIADIVQGASANAGNLAGGGIAIGNIAIALNIAPVFQIDMHLCNWI